MAMLRIKLCGVNNIDMAASSSVLKLSDSRLTSEWQLSQSGQIDLFIYGVDTEEGRSMLREHKQGVSAILTQKNQSETLANFLIKKPIRTKQLAEILNAAEAKIATVKPADKITPPPQPRPKKAVKTDKKPKSNKSIETPKLKPAKKPSLLGALSKHLSRRKSPASGLPSLTLSTPSPSDDKLNAIVDPKALATWIASLPANDQAITVDALLEKLVPLNRLSIAPDNRLALLELYRELVNALVFSRDVDTIKLEMSDPTVFEAKINQLNVFLEELALGYKTVVMASYQQGLRPNLDNTFLFAIIRAAESISLLTTNAFRHYRSAPTGAVHDLHQLYLYCEAAEVLDSQVSLKISETKKPFIHYYNQIMLTGIADPYSLAKYDVFRLFKLMGKMADKVTISPLSKHQRSAEHKTIIAGHFCLECHRDRLATPLHLVDQENRQSAGTRVLNPQGVLFAIEQIFEAAANTTTLGRYDLDIQLLKKVIPQFNASYQRQYQRLAPVTNRPIRLANGFDAIHRCLAKSGDGQATEWIIGNQGTAGLMAKCHKSMLPVINIGDFVGVFEANLAPRLGIIRWLQIDHNDIVQVGLQIHPGQPAATSLSPKGQAIETKCLYLPPIAEIEQAETMIVGKGGYSPNRTFRVKDGEKTYTIVTKKLLSYSLNYEQFNYKVLND